jgi:two-component system, NarL family, response regulator LiaR
MDRRASVGACAAKENAVEEARLEQRAPVLLPGTADAPGGGGDGKAAGETIRVLLADSRPLVLGALEELIDRQRPGMEAVGSAGNYERALYLAQREQPDVILLTLFQDTPDVLGAVAAVLRVCNAKVLVLKGMHDPIPAARLLRIGVAGVVSAEAPAEAIVNAVAQVHEARDEPASASARWSISIGPPRHSSRTAGEGVSRLTGRERELIRAVVENPGAKYLAIGAQLGISEHTVHNHLSSIYQKLNLVNRTDLLFYAVRHGLVEPPTGAWPGMN